jgi:hypothetical protein
MPVILRWYAGVDCPPLMWPGVQIIAFVFDVFVRNPTLSKIPIKTSKAS